MNKKIKIKKKIASYRGEAATDTIIELVIAVCVCAAVIAVLVPLFPGLAETLARRIQNLFS